MFPGCFYGHEATAWIKCDKKNPAVTLVESTELAQSLLDFGFIIRVSAGRQIMNTHLKHMDLEQKRFKSDSSIYRPNRTQVSPWRLHVRLISCSNLPKKGVIGVGRASVGSMSPDPYCKLYLGDEYQNTKVVMKTTNPRFEEPFTFGLDDPASAQLKVKCFHYDTIVPDHYICMAQLR